MQVSGRALALRDAHLRSTHGAWRLGDEVRPTSHRPHRFAATICADLLSALRAGTCCARSPYAFCIGPGWVLGDDMCASTHLGGTVVRCRRQPWKVHASEAALRISRCRNQFLQDPLSSRRPHLHAMHDAMTAHPRPRPQPFPWHTAFNSPVSRVGSRQSIEELCRDPDGIVGRIWVCR